MAGISCTALLNHSIYCEEGYFTLPLLCFVNPSGRGYHDCLIKIF